MKKKCNPPESLDHKAQNLNPKKKTTETSRDLRCSGNPGQILVLLREDELVRLQPAAGLGFRVFDGCGLSQSDALAGFRV